MKETKFFFLFSAITTLYSSGFLYGQAASLNADGAAPDANTMFDIKSNGNTSAFFGLKVKESGGSNLFVVRSDGNIGIGQSSPAAKLDLAGDFIQQSNAYHNFGTTVGTSGFGIRDNAGTMEFKNNAGAWAPIASTTSGAGWTKSGTNVFLTTGTDYVGMGISAPTDRLHVNYSSGGGAGGGVTIQNTASSGEIAGIALKCTATGANYYSSIMYEPDNAYWASNGIAQGMTFRTRTAGQNFAFQSGITAAAVKMWIDGGTGNMAIGTGTVTPNEKLTVLGSVSLGEITAPSLTAGYGKLYVKSSDSKLYFKNSAGTEIDLTAAGGTGGWSTSGSDVFLTTASNNVGVGMSIPNEKLTVEGTLSLDELGSAPSATSGYGKIYVKSSDNNLYYKDGLGVEVNLSSGASDFSNGGDAASATRKLGNTNAFDMVFTTNNTDRIYMKSTGNVGIGTNTSPSDFLHVNYSSGGGGGGGITVENTAASGELAVLKLFCSNSGASYNGQVLYAPDAGYWASNGIADGITFRSTGGGGNFAFQSGNTAGDVKMWIEGSTGNVGIGVPVTSTPGQRVEVNGGIRLNTATAKPTCNAAARGTFWFTQNGAGVKDACEVCAKDAADAYAWRVIY